MGLIKAKSKNINFFVRRIKTENSYIVITVHDEIDYVTDFSMLKFLAKKLSTYLDLTEYYKKFGVPYIRYLFDIEFDGWGAWTASTGLPVYELPASREENTAYKAYKDAVGLLKGASSVVKEDPNIIDLMIVDFTKTEMSSEEFVSKLEKLPEGDTVFKVKVSEKKFLKFYKKLEQNALLSLVENLGLKLID